MALWRVRRQLGSAGLALMIITAATTVASPPAFAATSITGTGSSFASVAMNQWSGQISQLTGDAVNYSTTSSETGLDDFAQLQGDFAVSDIGYSSLARITPPVSGTYQYLPIVASGVCLMYNLSDPSGLTITDLRLDGQTALDLFTGQITTWDDPRLQALQPSGVTLPDASVTTVYRSDPAGENETLAGYFDTLFPDQWAAYTTALQWPAGDQSIWPTPQTGRILGPYDFSHWVGQQGADNASNYVASSGNSITAVEVSYATEHQLPCASIENASGSFAEPSNTSVAVALSHAQLLPDLEHDLAPVFTAPETGVYPISSYSYLLTRAGNAYGADASQGLSEFIKFAVCRGQTAAGQLGYTPLPPNLVADDFAAIRRIGGAPDPGPLTAANCANPWLTGQSGLPTPDVTAIAPSSGPTAGGTTVTISGQNFLGATAVDFGSVAASDVVVTSDGSVVATAPPEGPGPVHVSVVGPLGTSSPSGADQFTYVSPAGYEMVAGDGGVFAFGLPFEGSAGTLRLNQPIVGLAPTTDQKGYWLVAADGGVFAFGDATADGSVPGLGLHVDDIVGMATSSQGGYWLSASDGLIYSFGGAPHLPSLPSLGVQVNDVVGITATPDGKGAYLVASDGGVFALGDAPFHGSMGAIPLNRAVVGLTIDPVTGGYWEVAGDGGVFAFDAPFEGSTGAIRLASPIVGLEVTHGGDGYWLAAADGGVFAEGDAPFLGSLPELAVIPASPIVGVTGE